MVLTREGQQQATEEQQLQQQPQQNNDHQQSPIRQLQDDAGDIAHLHEALQGLFAITQQQQAAIIHLQQNMVQLHPQNRATIKLPPFLSNDPRLWFAQVEALFRFHNVVDEVSKFTCIIGQLDSQGAQEIADIIRTPPADAPYMTLKDELIRHVSVSEQQRVRQPLTGEELGDRTPSQFLHHLRSLSGAVPDFILRTLWTQRLPSHVQAIIQPHMIDPTITMDRLASIADNILEVTPAVPAQFAPVCITTDQGQQFESQLFRALGNTFGITRCRTCGYHPCSNGMVECFHRQLEAALRCHPHLTWVDALPLVLLGLRSVVKEDLRTSPAELVYGEPLRLPAGFIAPMPGPRSSDDVSNFVARLRQQMSKLRPVPASRHNTQSPFVFQELSSCGHVFLREDRIRRSLESPYTGPHPVVRRDEKTITILVNGLEKRVSLDRVKPAFMDTFRASSHCTAVSSPARSTRAFRRVRFRLPDLRSPRRADAAPRV